MVEILYGCSIGTKSPYKLKPYAGYVIFIFKVEHFYFKDRDDVII